MRRNLTSFIARASRKNETGHSETHFISRLEAMRNGLIEMLERGEPSGKLSTGCSTTFTTRQSKSIWLMSAYFAKSWKRDFSQVEVE